MTIALVVVFFLAYVLIALERALRMDKSAVALASAAILWTLVASSGTLGTHVHAVVSEHLAPIAEIVIFLMGAMAIVEVIDSHHGFRFLTDRMTMRRKRTLLVTIGIATFVLSAILDNLATTIVMMAVTLRFVTDRRDKVVFTGIVVIAANAGGAFSPIGDVTTTMLWIGGQISSGAVISRVFLPSFVALLLPLLAALAMIKGPIDGAQAGASGAGVAGGPARTGQQALVFFVGIGSLVSVPLFKLLTGLPPFMGVLGALALIWILTEALQRGRPRDEDQDLRVARALERIDLPSILFFVGILLSVAALEVGGILGTLAAALDSSIGDRNLIAVSLGFLSAVFDNVPLVAATMRMYPLDVVPMDSPFWHLLAFTAGCGGSMLIIGSAAGVTAMGSSKVSFGSYAAKVGPLALLGYLGGLAVFLVEGAFAR